MKRVFANLVANALRSRRQMVAVIEIGRTRINEEQTTAWGLT